MIRLRLGPEALARVRFGISPLVETMRSVVVLRDPAARALHLSWVAETLRVSGDLDLSPLVDLQPPDKYSPDFVQLPPGAPLVEFEAEVARMQQTPAAQVRCEIVRTYADGSLPASLRELVENPRRGLRRLAELLREYWHRAVEPHWPRIRALLEGDVLYRARRMADGGADALFADLHPILKLSHSEVLIDKRAHGDLELDERGLLLMPSVFAWRVPIVLMDPVWQPTIVYPARGVGMLWKPATSQVPTALAALFGRRRGDIFIALDQPRTTLELARRFGIPASSVSQHLGVLRQAGLVSGHRVGRQVLYVRTPRGDALAGTPQ